MDPRQQISQEMLVEELAEKSVDEPQQLLAAEERPVEAEWQAAQGLPAASSAGWQKVPPQAYQDAMRAFQMNSTSEVARVKRNLTGLSDDDKASLTWKPDDQVKIMEEAVSANLAFLEKISDLIRKAPQLSVRDRAASLPQGFRPVQHLLQTFTREWSEEGLEERRGCFERLLGALDSHTQASPSDGAQPRVLCPGSQLGRLAFEVQSRKYAVEACEGRLLSFFGSEFVRQHCAERNAHPIQPFALQTCNRFCTQDHVRVTAVPDVEIQRGSLPPVRFGDFIQLYDSASARAGFDAVLTAFALDTSSNIFRYVRTVAHVLRPGGLWANFGPLAYDTQHDEAHGHGVELSWEELRYAVSHFFDIQEEDFVDAFYAANNWSMMQIQYSCVYFKAVRNSTPALGIGKT